MTENYPINELREDLEKAVAEMNKGFWGESTRKYLFQVQKQDKHEFEFLVLGKKCILAEVKNNPYSIGGLDGLIDSGHLKKLEPVRRAIHEFAHKYNVALGNLGYWL